MSTVESRLYSVRRRVTTSAVSGLASWRMPDSIETMRASVGRMRDNPLPSGSSSEFDRIYGLETALDVGSLGHCPVILLCDSHSR